MIYYCCANNKNIGDHYSLLGLEKLIGIESKHIFMAGSPKNFRDSLSKLSFTDTLIIGGGGLLKDHFEKYWKIILEEQMSNGFTIGSFGIGVCDIKGKSTVINDKMLEDIAYANKALYLRPYIPNRLRLSAKEVFCPSNYYFSKFRKRKGEKYLLYAEHPKLIGEKENLKIKKILESYSKNNNLEMKVVNHMDDLDYLDIYSKAKLIITSRLHGLILASSLDKKVIPISNDRKIEGYANKLGSLENVIDLKKVSPEFLEKKIVEYVQPKFTSSDINKSLEESIEQFKIDLGV